MHVVRAVAESINVDPLELPPLYEVIDPDALDALVDPVGGRLGFTVTFEYAGCKITITDDGEVVITVERLREP